MCRPPGEDSWLTKSRKVANRYLVLTQGGSPAEVNLLIFAPAFSLVSLACLELAPRFAPWPSQRTACLIVEALNALFYFTGFIAIAVLVGGMDSCDGPVCAAARADAVLAATQFSTWIATSFLMAQDMFKNGPDAPPGEFGRQRREGQPMTQV